MKPSRELATLAAALIALVSGARAAQRKRSAPMFETDVVKTSVAREGNVIRCYSCLRPLRSPSAGGWAPPGKRQSG